MSRRKGISHEQKLINALKKLPNPLEDKKHNILIYFNDGKARSNQSRFEHIVDAKHELSISDIERIPRLIKHCIFKKDNRRSDSYCIYLKRNNFNGEYIKISIQIISRNPASAVVKTIFITKNIK